jgi:hypothetical protein
MGKMLNKCKMYAKNPKRQKESIILKSQETKEIIIFGVENMDPAVLLIRIKVFPWIQLQLRKEDPEPAT